ncbi:MAG: hypothetical protein AAF416_05590 [Pseudomonadota bacterium]
MSADPETNVCVYIFIRNQSAFQAKQKRIIVAYPDYAQAGNPPDIVPSNANPSTYDAVAIFKMAYNDAIRYEYEAFNSSGVSQGTWAWEIENKKSTGEPNVKLHYNINDGRKFNKSATGLFVSGGDEQNYDCVLTLA